MQLWLIPTLYAIGSVAAGLLMPRLEATFLAVSLNLSTSSAQAYLSAVASGMMALTGIVFSIAFVLVQFNAVVYSPRLVVWFARDRLLFHSLGMFVATFMYSLSTLAWVDRQGAEGVPFLSAAIVAAMLVASVLMLAQLVQRLNNLQIIRVLQALGDIGRQVIVGTYQAVPWRTSGKAVRAQPFQGPPELTVRHIGNPQSVTSIDIAGLVGHARRMDGFIMMECGVGDTLLEGSVILHAHGANALVGEKQLSACVHLDEQRTFEQDPKYAMRLLVDVAIKALSPAINDPTTAVQAIDQIEDMLRRLAKCDLEACRAYDDDGVLRVVYRMPTWEDYLALAFDEIRQFGSTSIQVMRRLRAALAELGDCARGEHAKLVRDYLGHLDSGIERSSFDAQDRAAARIEDRQGLGLSHHHGVASPAASNEEGRVVS
ncbi:hypothetical protein C7U92_04170 [Bradyrhizobium sp. WBOS7]|uniref:DUF2254 domain-containing protein n=1 Tax=Bradyrhizobium betae TaxID=244734 RepID=A0AAE9N839_9BRAD|nr:MULTISPECIES: DUF2254 domain-containing protein [Bradyrhizobium]MDD1569834.1 hypothetical protein [Bradyrhizobium sp. WBOS1]UUO35698.1 hypothetical protein DCK84_14750 [Bradyrhizobium sp. WBOS01]MDD1526523.1 hypothetical protein [Bradyrhizobium sp. WBOS2]MDD1575933.1 hypothetical protein [Bradyrhizobium sp. WBOS7]MDD1599478.1 hypothetical protein [Bradyrhizobium sp. WBOS16]